MVRSISVAAAGVTVAVGLGGVVLTGALGIAAAAPDEDARSPSAQSGGADTRTQHRGARAPRTSPGSVGTKQNSPGTAASRRQAAPTGVRPAAVEPDRVRPAVAQLPAIAPAAATQPPVVKAVAKPTAASGSLRSRFNNQTPRLYPTQSGQSASGVVTGRLNAVDPDSPRLSFTVAQNPANGTAAVTADGSWTYTPNPPTAHAGGIDSFRVTVSDAPSGFAIHGLAGLLHMLSFGRLGSRGDSSTATVTVTVTPVAADNNPPTGRASTTGTDPLTGRVDGVVNGNDADGDTLAYAAPGTTAKGSFTINAASGAFSYTPNATARHNAARTGAGADLTTDTLTVTITDGHGGAATVPVSLTISPANTAPTAGTPAVGTPDPATGAVTGRVAATDSDADPLTYATPPTTGKGSVTLDGRTGAFTYTPTAAARRNAGAPGATEADRSDGFTVTVTDAHGGATTAAVAVAVSPVEQPPATPGQLRAADLSLEGFFRVPTGQLAAGQYATLAYGGAALASRMVDGQRHFFLTGHRYANDPLVELVAPASLGDTASSAPVAPLYRYWGDIYGGRKVTAEESDPAQPNANWTEGLLWDETNQRLLWSYGNWYAAQHVNNPVLGATKLGADGSVTVQGPWRTSSESQQTRSFAVFLSPAVSAAMGGAALGLGGKMQSINASASWGPSLHVINSASGDPATPITARALISHPISPTTRRTPRAADYRVISNGDGTVDTAGTEPPVDGVGFWTELDETTGAVFVHTGSDARSALVYSGSQASGLIWYGPDGEYGVTDGRGYDGKGNHAQHYRPVLWLVSEADVVAAAEGRLNPDQVNPYATVDLMTQFPELAFLQGISAGQPVFAADEGRLYVPFIGGDVEGREPYPLIAVFSVAD